MLIPGSPIPSTASKKAEKEKEKSTMYSCSTNAL